MSTPHVITKNGMYYAHNNCGYVSRVLLAELYDETYATDYAKLVEGCRAVPITELLTGSEEVQEYIDRLEVMRDAMAEIENTPQFGDANKKVSE